MFNIIKNIILIVLYISFQVKAEGSTLLNGGEGGSSIFLTKTIRLAAIPTVNEKITKDTTPTITGTNGLNSGQPAGETLTVTVNGATYEVIPDNRGRWSVNTAVDVPVGGALGTFPDGKYEVLAEVTDLSGNITSDITTDELTIDTILPDYPLIDFMVTSDNTPVITGTWDHIDGVYIQVNVNGTVYKLGQHPELTIDGSGNWTVDLSMVTLADGEYNIEVLTRDEAGNNRTDTTRGEVIIDTTSPTVAILNAPTAVNSTNAFIITVQFDEYVTGFSISDLQVINAGKNNFTPLDGSTYTIEISPNGAGDISLNIAAGLAADVVGNLNLTAQEVMVIYDITNPQVPTINSLITSNLTPVLTGTNGLGSSQPSDESISVNVNNASFVVIPTSDGSWSLDLSVATPTSGNLGAFVDGDTYEVIVTVTDIAGNATQDTSNDELTIDTTDPVNPTVPFLTTSDGTPIINGTAEAFSQITMILNGVSFGTLTNASGTWSINTQLATPIAGGAFTALPDAVYDIKVISTDQAGNTSSDNTTDELIIDATGPTSPSVDIIYVSNITPVITGNNSLNAPQPGSETLNVLVNGANYRPIPDSNGLWTINTGSDTPFSGTLGVFSEGVYEVVASVTDGASNTVTDGTSNELTIDLTNPSIPVVNTLLTNDQTPTITGTAEANSYINLTINAVEFDVRANASGTWSVKTGVLTPSSGGPFIALSDAIYEVDVISIDLAGNTSADASSNELTIDSTPPIAPTVNVLATNDTSPQISGTNGLGTSQPAGESLTVSINGASYTITSNGSGMWSINTETQAPTSGALGAFTDGSYNVNAVIADNAGNSTVDATNNELIIDATAPAVPTIDFQTTNDPSPVLTGTAEVSSTVRININGVEFETIATLSGTWSIDTETEIPTAAGPFLDLSDGVYNIVARSTDEVGNQTFDDSANQLTIDTEVPSIPVINLLTTNDTNPTLTGTAEAGSKVVVVVSGVSFRTTANGSGNWSLNTQTDTPIAGGPFAALVDGLFEIEAISTDAAGNNSVDDTNNELTIDTTPPNLPTVNLKVTNNISPVIDGTNGYAASLPAGESLTILVNGANFHVIPNLSGEWILDLATATPTNGTLGVFEEGIYEVMAQITDMAGNTAIDNTANELVIDLTAPIIPLIDQLETNDVTPTITGSAEANSDITLLINGVSFLTNTDGTGDWLVNTENAIADAGGPFVDLTDGVFNLSLNSTDEAGNTASDATVDELIIDTTAPSIPTINSTLTNETFPMLEGTAEAGTNLTIIVNGVSFKLTVAVDGFWILNTQSATPQSGGPFTALVDGTYEIAAISEDLAGNTSADTSSDELIIDTTAPSVPIINEQETDNATPTITGTAETNTSIILTVNGATFETTVQGDGTWSVNTSADTPISGGPFSNLPDGVYDVEVSSIDAAGNESTDATTDELRIITVILTAPTVNNLVSNDGLPTLTGTWDEANATTLSVAVAGQTYVLGVDIELSNDAFNQWKLDLSTLAQPLADGVYEVAVLTTNATQSVGDETSNELTVSIPVIIDIPTVNNLQSDNGLPVLTGTWDHINATILVVNVATTNYSLSADAELTTDNTGNWMLDLSNLSEPLSSGVYDVLVTSSDGEGNSATDATEDELLVDIAVLQVPTVNPLESNNGLPVITGTWDNIEALSLNITVAGSSYTFTSDAELTTSDNNWQLDLSGLASPIVNGLYDVEVVTANNNNTVSDLTTNELIVDNPQQDLDQDHVFDVDEDVNNNGNLDDDDTDGDGIANYLDIDDDGDQVPTIDEDYENDGNPQNEDTDSDGIPDYLDADDDGDGISTLAEDVDNNGDPRNDDTDEDGIPDYLDAIDNSIGSADLMINMTVSVGPYLIGQELTYNILVTNVGPDVASAVEVEGILPAELTFIDSQSSAGSYNDITGLWNIGNLEVGASDTLMLLVQIDAKGIVDYSAIIAGNEIDENAANNEVTVSIEVMEEFNISKGFSPNGDGNNDNWRIAGIDLFPNNSVKVFNRWGNEVFSVKNYNNDSNSWDGSNQGSLSASNGVVPDGTYFYVIELQSDLPKITGYLTVKQ